MAWFNPNFEISTKNIYVMQHQFVVAQTDVSIHPGQHTVLVPELISDPADLYIFLESQHLDISISKLSKEKCYFCFQSQKNNQQI